MTAPAFAAVPGEVPVARAPQLLLEGVPRRWLAGDRVATHLVNAVNLLFPAGERFFVRSVHRHAGALRDPALRERVRGFERQEGHHARAHEAWFAELERQGFRIDRFLALYQRLCFGLAERVAPAALALSVTVALEHFTALLARGVSRGVLEAAHPEMRRLLLWHAAEELEHKSVAFDVLRAVRPSWALRAAGLAVATGFLACFWVSACALLLWQDRGPAADDAAPRAAGARRPEARVVVREVFLGGIADYLRPGFHPDQVDDRQRLHAFLADAGLA
jgi:predicted metal-dependent hydrolase